MRQWLVAFVAVLAAATSAVGCEIKVGCVNTNCEGPYHGYWAIDGTGCVNS